MLHELQPTHFAPAERAPNEVIHDQRELVLNTAFLGQLYDAVNEMVVILNEQRQIVFFNKMFAEILANPDPGSVLGKRPGEALRCVHSGETIGGCGTSEFCSTCGAANAILSAIKGLTDTKECRVLQDEEGDALDLLVKASPLSLNGQRFTVFAVMDVSHEKRRSVLERVFFHDIMNTVSSIAAFAELLAMEKEEKTRQMGHWIHKGVLRLKEELAGHRDLLAAERKELCLDPVLISSLPLLRDLIQCWSNCEGPSNSRIELSSSAEDVPFISDRNLLGRVLTNMFKNAVEACGPDGVVTAGAAKSGDTHVQFWVHNPGVMEKEVQLQLFQRSFSTKGLGRGLGTYSMKLLTERYLKGQITFRSSPEQGTTFYAYYPLNLTG